MILTPYARDPEGNIIKDTPVEDGMQIAPKEPTKKPITKTKRA